MIWLGLVQTIADHRLVRVLVVADSFNDVSSFHDRKLGTVGRQLGSVWFWHAMGWSKAV